MQFDIDIAMTVGSVHRSLFGKHTGRRFSLDTRIVCDVDTLVLVGPSGSGKSLTLQAVAGLLNPSSGRISIGGKVFFDSEAGICKPPRDRKVGYVFQDYALFPHCSVRQNIAFGLKRWSFRLGTHERALVDEVMDVFGIRALEDARPAEISGGQRQRTSLARALVAQPDVLLLDEPFSALDQPLRLRMRDELQRILAHYSIPMIMVTHDVDEAEYFAQTVVIYAHGGVRDIVNAANLPAGEGSLSACVGEVLRSAYETV